MRKSIAEVAKLYGEEYKKFFECVDFLAAPDSSTITQEILENEWNPKKMDNTCNYGMPLTMYYETYDHPDNGQDIVIFKIHKGGDPRGNYSKEFVFVGSWCVFWELIDRFGGANIVKTYNGIEFKYNLAEQSVYKDGSIISKGEFFDLTGVSLDEFF